MNKFLPAALRQRCLLLTAVVTLCLGASAHGQGRFTFSGGNGALALNVTLQQPIVFTITITTAATATLNFVVQNTGDLSHIVGTASGTLSFSVNGGAPITLYSGYSNYAGGNTTVNDLSFVNSFDAETLRVGDRVVLNAGQITLADDTDHAPASGAYSVFVADNSGYRISGFGGAVVPEPSTWLAVAFGAGALAVVRAGRRRSVA